MILTITGPSGSGKSTLSKLLAQHMGAKPIESVTTRLPRESDPPGELSYVSDKEFDALAKAGVFLNVYPVHRYRFGTRIANIELALQECALRVAVLTIEGARDWHTFTLERGALSSKRSIYLCVEVDTLRQRLTARSDDADEIVRRMVECANWNEKARFAGVRFNFVDNNGSEDKMLVQTKRVLAPKYQPLFPHTL